MANESVDASVEIGTDDYRTELGFLMLALAQLVSFFGFWFGFWPDAFGVPTPVGHWSAAFFLVGGMVGFYLSFRTLSMT